ncbi:MAG TPA: hypothetical protein VNA17_12295 [Pyrinomonadaceae bacterium]|nr:hypothetical protein [Pyrinomonadaceae bacterium]
MLAFLTPIRIIKRPDRLTILDYRPTLYMFLAMVGFLIFSVSFLLFFLGIYEVDSFGVWSTLVMSFVCLLVSLRGTLREAYYFDKATDSYAFVRHFIYRKEVIEGASSQFRGVRVHMIDEEGRNRTVRYIVNLLQDGMLFGSSPELTLREVNPILNFHSIETRIAKAIASFLEIKLIETSD